MDMKRQSRKIKWIKEELPLLKEDYRRATTPKSTCKVAESGEDEDSHGHKETEQEELLVAVLQCIRDRLEERFAQVTPKGIYIYGT